MAKVRWRTLSERPRSAARRLRPGPAPPCPGETMEPNPGPPGAEDGRLRPGAKRVTFPSDEDIVSGAVEPKDPWRHGNGRGRGGGLAVWAGVGPGGIRTGGAPWVPTWGPKRRLYKLGAEVPRVPDWVCVGVRNGGSVGVRSGASVGPEMGVCGVRNGGCVGPMGGYWWVWNSVGPKWGPVGPRLRVAVGLPRS